MNLTRFEKAMISEMRKTGQKVLSSTRKLIEIEDDGKIKVYALAPQKSLTLIKEGRL